MQVRPAVAADVPAVEDVYVRSWRAAYVESLPPDVLDEQAAVRRRRHDWAAGVAAEDGVVAVAVDEAGRVRGVVQAVLDLPLPRDRPEILMLYVDPDAWGNGVAAELLAFGERWIAGRGHAEARLRVVADHHRARRFYEREGWVLDDGVRLERTDLATLVAYRRVLGPGQTSISKVPS